jgi:hypothetical protein
MIGGIDPAQTYAPPTAQGPAGRFGQMLQPVASLLGLSEGDLTAQLKSGKSLDDIASEKGVSQSDLVSTLTQSLASVGGLPQNADPTQLAQQLAQQQGLGHHHHHHHHHGGGSATPPVTTDGSTQTTDPTSPSHGQRIDTVA